MTTINPNQPTKTSPAKMGAKIGALAGVALGTFKHIKNKQLLKDIFESSELNTLPKGVKAASMVLGIGISMGIYTGLSSLIGAGVGKLAGLFKKDTPKEAQ